MTPSWGGRSEEFRAELAKLARDGRCYVYVLSDPRSGAPFYVGKGTGNRVLQHERDARARRFANPVRTQTILGIWHAGLDVQYSFARRKPSEQ